MRPTNESILGPYRYEQDGPAPWMPVFSSHTYPILARSYSGVRTPEFRTKKRLRTLPVNPYHMDVIRCSAGSTIYTRTAVGNVVKTLEVHHSGSTPFDGQFPRLGTDARNKATLKLYKKVEGVKVNLAQFLAERKQVADLLASTATRLHQSVRALRRADWRSFAGALSLSRTETRELKQSFEKVYRTRPADRISHHWLEYVYGWRPLLQDLHDSAELLAESISTYEGPEGVLRASGHERQKFRLESTRPFGATGGVILPQRTDYHVASARITVHWRLDSEARSLLNKTGISNPALLAWELLPYSFVIDWLVPVGTYLQSLTAMDGFTITRGSISILETAISERQVAFSSGSGGDAYVEASRAGPPIECTQAIYDRTPTTDFPYALKVRSPIGGNPLERFITSVALIGAAFANPRDIKSLGTAGFPLSKP